MVLHVRSDKNDHNMIEILKEEWIEVDQQVFWLPVVFYFLIYVYIYIIYIFFFCIYTY